MQKSENRKWILAVMKACGEKNGNNVQYQFWIQDDEAKEIYSEDFLEQKCEYIHYNPVKAQYVFRQEDWVWSSAWMYTKNDFRFIDRLDG